MLTTRARHSLIEGGIWPCYNKDLTETYLYRSFFGGKHGANSSGDGTGSKTSLRTKYGNFEYYSQQTAKAFDTRIMSAKSAKILGSNLLFRSLCSLRF